MKITPPSRGALRAPREGKMILKLFVKIHKIPTQGRQDFKPLNLWEGSEKSLFICKENFYYDFYFLSRIANSSFIATKTLRTVVATKSKKYKLLCGGSSPLMTKLYDWDGHTRVARRPSIELVVLNCRNWELSFNLKSKTICVIIL